jgi:hypothetical protein
LSVAVVQAEHGISLAEVVEVPEDFAPTSAEHSFLLQAELPTQLSLAQVVQPPTTAAMA